MKKVSSLAYSTYRQIVDDHVAPLLLSHGFVPKKLYGLEGFLRACDDTRQWIMVDLHWDSNTDIGRFDIYVHIHFPKVAAVLRASGISRVEKSMLQGIGGHIIQLVLPPRDDDEWLMVHSHSVPHVLRTEILRILSKHVLPFLETYSQLETIIPKWRRGLRSMPFASPDCKLLLPAAYHVAGHTQKAITYILDMQAGITHGFELISTQDHADFEKLLTYLRNQASDS